MKRIVRVFVIVLISLFLIACGDDGNAAKEGSEGGPCFKDGTCNEGLDCLLGICVDFSETNDSDSGDSGDSGNTGDTGNTGNTGPKDTGVVDSNIPEPIITVKFEEAFGGPVSYRSIKDDVMMNLESTCVSDPDNDGKCLSDWSDKYYIKYKWEMIESPTPLRQETHLDLYESYGMPGNWYPDYENENPKRAKFVGLMVTPVRSAEDNPDFDEAKCVSECGEQPADVQDSAYPVNLADYLICRQKYCEKKKNTYYKVKIQAVTVDLETGNNSETSEVIVVPNIIPQSRVVAQLTWKQGFRTKTEAESDIEGTKVDLDIHLIKRSSLEADTYGYKPTDGVMCTYQLYEGMDYSPTEDIINDGHPDYEKYFRHDDCSFADQGFETVNAQAVTGTIAWHASFDIENRWGGSNYENPETIGLGPIEDKNGDGKPDKQIIDDQYLVVVNYAYCTSKGFEDKSWNTCCDPADSNCNGDGSAYKVDARVDILIDGFEAARPERTQGGTVIRPADNYSETSKYFTIKPDEWKVVAVIKWDSSLPGPESNPSYPGDAIVTDIVMANQGIEIDPLSYKTCKFDITLCELVPIWDEAAYYDYVDQPQNPNDENSPLYGECY